MTALGAMRVLNRDRWLATLRKALEDTGGRIPAAAKALGVSVRQLSRWLAEDPTLPRSKPGRPEVDKAAGKKASGKRATKTAAGSR